MSKAADAIGQLDPKKWAATDAQERLRLLKEIQKNLYDNMEELGASDAKMKNERLGQDNNMYSADVCKITTVVPISNNIVGSIDLYQSIISDKLMEPNSVTKVADGLYYDIHVAPRTIKEKVFYGFRSDRLRVKGEPKRISNPLEKETKVIAVLGAGNYSSAVEIIKGIFYDNCVVAHKPHPLNEETDKIWARIMAPLVDVGALSFCSADQGPDMTTDKRVDVIYFTGGVHTAKAIMKTTSTPLVCESGGVNPTIIVPGDRDWTEKELTHHAMQIVSMGKLNGGHICARPELIVTCKNWPQREAFLEQLEKAIVETTPAVGSYYPGSSDVMKRFKKAYPNGKLLKPEDGKYKSSSDVLLVTGDTEDGFASKNEAFCQVFVEVPLDTAANAADFIPRAVEYCNNKMVGSLCAGIILDETTRKENEDVLNKAITDLEYGSIGINILPAHVFSSPYLIWGGNNEEEEGKPLVSGNGHFGNLFGYENAEKSILDDAFVSPGQMVYNNKAAVRGIGSTMATFSVWPSWYNLVKFVFTAIKGSFYSKDW